MEIMKENEKITASGNKEAPSAGTYVHKFATPWEYEGKRYEQITFEFGKLTGYDSLAIENEIQAMGKALITPEFSGDFLLRMAARASTPHIGADVIQAMPIVDFNRIRSRARSFLLNLGL